MTRHRLLLAVAVLTASASVSCGYRSLNAQTGVSGAGAGLHVALQRSLVPDVIVANEVLEGARAALAKRGALLGGAGYPCLFIEVLRSDFVAEGIASSKAGPPHARATDIGVTGRGWVVGEAEAPPTSDTGDMRAFDVVGIDSDPMVQGAHDRGGEHRAARLLGEQLARRVLGEPTLSDVPLVK